MRIGERDGAALRAAPRASNSFMVRVGLISRSHGGLRGWRALQSGQRGGGCPLEGPRAPTQTRRVVVDVCSSLKKGAERSVTRIPPLPFLQSALVALERAPPRRGARQGPLSGQGGARACCSHMTPLDPRTAHAIQRPAAVGGGRAHTHRTVRHSWRRTGHHGGGAGPRRPRRAAARETALVGEAASGGTPPCGRGHSHHTMCRTQRRRGRLAGGRFRAPRRAEPRAKAGEGRPAPPHAPRAHRAPCVRPQRPVDPTFTRRVKVGCSRRAPTSAAVCAAPGQGTALARGRRRSPAPPHHPPSALGPCTRPATPRGVHACTLCIPLGCS